MDQELKQYLIEMEARIIGQVEARIVGQVDARADARFEAMRQHIAGVVDAAEERMKDFARQTAQDMETRIVRSFMDLATAHEARIKNVETGTRTAVDTLLERMSALESRVLRLEGSRYSQ